MAIVEYEKRGRVSIVTMNRPERLNAMGPELGEGLCDAWTTFRDDEEAWIGIITGVGRAFCSGMDVKWRAETGLKGLGLPEVYSRDPFWTEKLDKPVIAAVNGLA